MDVFTANSGKVGLHFCPGLSVLYSCLSLELKVCWIVCMLLPVAAEISLGLDVPRPMQRLERQEEIPTVRHLSKPE